MATIEVEMDEFSDSEIIREFAYRMKSDRFRDKVNKEKWGIKPWDENYEVDFHIPTLINDVAHEMRKLGKLDLAFKLEQLK